MIGLYIFGKIKELPYTIENDNSLKNTVLTVEVVRPFQDSHGQYTIDTFECVMWRGISASILENCKIGDRVGIKGRLESQTIVDEQGKQSYKYNIVAEFVRF
ncbi:MAG: single-stranded DNA-binding protein [Erysipelothrix sp.]|nr:single-stranded DNA-binding protein [Erysipelothrix sp.]